MHAHAHTFTSRSVCSVSLPPSLPPCPEAAPFFPQVPMCCYLLKDNTSRWSLGQTMSLNFIAVGIRSPRLTQTFWGCDMIKASTMRGMSVPVKKANYSKLWRMHFSCCGECWVLSTSEDRMQLSVELLSWIFKCVSYHWKFKGTFELLLQNLFTNFRSLWISFSSQNAILIPTEDMEVKTQRQSSGKGMAWPSRRHIPSIWWTSQKWALPVFQLIQGEWLKSGKQGRDLSRMALIRGRTERGGRGEERVHGQEQMGGEPERCE